MSTNPTHYKNVLKFWRAMETFSLPDIPTRKKYDSRIFTALEPGKRIRFPWEPGVLAVPAEGKQWRHTLYFNVVAKETVVELLARLSGSTEFRDPVSGNTCLSALVVDHPGRPAVGTYSPAAFLYGIKIIRDKSDPEDLPKLLKKAQEDYSVRFKLKKEQGEDKQPEPTVLEWDLLEKELDWLQKLGGNALKAATSILCVSETIAVTTNLEAPFLNSYYVHDLNTLIHHPGDLGRPMEIYLTEEIDRNTRYNLLDQEALLRNLSPQNQSPGRWPSNPHFGLYSAQQAALNLALPALRQSSGLLGINGPPGTGKTTLLREVIADVVVTRAKRLLKADVSGLFANKRVPIADMLSYYPIDPTVFGNDGIVVSSNNNAAIENISKELPVVKSIDRKTFTDEEYFSGIASNILEEPCWGMLSAVLGKSGNRSSFVDKFWFAKGNNFRHYLKEQYEDPVQSKKNVENYAQTARELQSLLDEYEVFQTLAGAHHELLNRILADGGDREKQQEELLELAARLGADYGIPAGNLPDLRFLHLPVEAIHKLTPYSSERINTLRSRIFLQSLELHEWAIRVNARYFSANLNAFVNMLSNKHPDAMDEKITAVLWRSLFFVIPVVSVTLASFQRQFAKMRQGAIGWLLLDEAGQATPSSACGAIWRSERCILIGDTLQIPPVVTMPQGLGQLLQETYGIGDDCWSPLLHSAQSLADRITAAGTYVRLGDGGETWTGIPLRAHRRCSEPMFSISNFIAYNGQMVKVTQDDFNDIPTGESGWIDVRSVTVSDGHTVLEELDVLDDLLQRLLYYEGKIYIISPFRSVAEDCKARFYEKDRIECGTIHTFQGKEAGIVFLVLGTHPGNSYARDWVSGTPNMLNVAVTRAKERLYVIGDRRAWGRHRYFDHLVRRMPVKEHFSGRLF